MQNIYSVYMHMNLKNKKRYYGITRLNVEDRWNNGNGYASNQKFYNDIQKYGWDGFLHKVIATNLNYYEARQLEYELIKEYDTVENGYNGELTSMADKYNFKYFDFKIFNYEHIERHNFQFFIKIPNYFIQTDLKKEFNIHRIFYFVWIAIARNKTLENMSYITIEEIFNMCHYKTSKNRPKIFSEVIKCICFLNENCFIQCDIDPFNVSYRTRIEIYVVDKYFNPTEKFTIIKKEHLDVITRLSANIGTEHILTVFLYISSYIGCRKRNEDGSELENPQNNPEAFWKSINNMAKDLGMSKSTIYQCIDYLTTYNNDTPPLLIKHNISEFNNEENLTGLPSIYVLNKKGYKNEIKWAINKMKEIYDIK